MSIRIRRVRLVGLSKDYEVSFLREGAERPLSVVAGEISTGKSSVLEFVDYCLGASHHPRHQEIQRRVRAAMLEVDLSGQVVTIERALFSTDSAAFVHQCTLDSFEAPHGKQRRPLSPVGDPNSLSTLLLEHCGLAGISLKESPSQPDSRLDPLSFRDVMWLCFLPNERIGSKHLLHEGQFMQQLKLRQVIEVIFGVHDDRLAQESGALNAAQQRQRQLQQEVASLETFLSEQSVQPIAEIDTAESALVENLREIEQSLTRVTSEMRAASAFAENLREEFGRNRRAAAMAAAEVRDRDTLLRRLLPLRGQYAEDEKKLIFYEEARQLFDPLSLNVCPSCMQSLPEAVTIRDGACTLCGQPIHGGPDPIDVRAELLSVRTRKREIDKYVQEVESALAEARVRLRRAEGTEAQAQARLDSQVAETLAPFVAQRDDLVRRQEQVAGARSELSRQRGLHEGLQRRRTDLAEVEHRIAALRERIQALEAERPSKQSVVADLSRRFASLLVEFGYPKLEDPEPPYIDGLYVPHVRGNPYRDVGSTGGLTLVALAWFLAIYERAVASGASHPGFAMIDSPQKNLTPRQGDAGDEFTDPAIVSRVWSHISRAAHEQAASGQMLVVDNSPPPFVEESVVVRYSGRANMPPYGLVDDETS